ncbi:hypothetical protein [Lunatimonas salinarum]|uniref:hypothetical protein n=1 Tax=Lunatimonas salinarum TaxID=1774590 RepID=UPI001AE0211B|nr:hypothetical protein [Lunatimonas salinarum]
MALFQNSVRKKYLSHQDQQPMLEAFEAYRKYFHNAQIHANIRVAKEEKNPHARKTPLGVSNPCGP